MFTKPKKLIAVFLSLSLLIAVSVPMIVLADTGTLVSETPHIYTTFSQDSTEVDGNDLSAGTYDVDFMVKGVKNIAAMEITASYDQTVLTINSLNSDITDTHTDISAMDNVFESGKMIFGYFSTNANTSAVDDAGTLIVSMNVTVNTDESVDFADVVTVSSDPGLTLIQCDYDDAQEDVYGLDTSFEGYSGNIYPMTADLSPSLQGDSFTVTGTTYQMINLSGDMGNIAPGLTVTVGEQSTTTDATGYFELDGIAPGNYTLTIVGDSTVDREMSITISDSDLDLGDVAVVCCNYSKDSLIDPKDKVVYMRADGAASDSENYNIFADLNGDNTVDGKDKVLFFHFYDLDVNTFYDELS